MFAFAVTAQIKRPSPPPVKKPFSEFLQAVIVITKEWKAVEGIARLYERKTPRSKWRTASESFPVVVGRGGLGLGDSPTELWQKDLTGLRPLIKREGDGKSPAGLFPLIFAFGSQTAPGSTKLSYVVLDEFAECVDDAESSHYNTIVNRMRVGNFDWKSSEKMLAVGEQYDRGIVVGYNSYPPKSGLGSCIFLHIWKDAFTGTSGCTAMKRSDLENLLARLDPARNPYLVQLPAAEYIRHKKPWKLPKLKIPWRVYL